MRSDAQPDAAPDPPPDIGPSTRPDSTWTGPTEPRGSTGRPPGRRIVPVIRVLDALAGLLAAGVLVFGVGLLLAQVLAPALLSAAGWGAATGPGWVRVLAHLLVGAAGEVVVRARHRWAGTIRAVADVAVIAAALAVVARAWWP